ncbi:EPSP synthase (3-phosphoshikimate 1-carboxyvinyltransferase) [Fragilaria crotonensis]|nr:EPSP synthase (3-phosphoshikimate 1-carboxyvinyltransferase) [Fragilaria crotonensis]
MNSIQPPHVALTIGLMNKRGVRSTLKERIKVTLADAAITGDAPFANLMVQLGIPLCHGLPTVSPSPEIRPSYPKFEGVDVDCGEIPDAAMTLAVMALVAEGSTTSRNV